MNRVHIDLISMECINRLKLSDYVPPSLTLQNSTFCTHSVFMCTFKWISEQTAIIFLNNINELVFITERKRVYCAVRA